MKSYGTNPVIGNLIPYLKVGEATPFNYERYLLTEKAAYLIAFIEKKPFPPFEIEIQMSSACNLRCRWCIGEEIQYRKHVSRLPNTITAENVDKITEAIIHFRVNQLGVETVKFSGFIGEPLVNKKATLKAIRLLSGAGLRVGLFTNGVLMDSETWNILANIDHVHVSLDAGPSSFFWLKESALGPSGRDRKASYSEESYYKVIENIRQLNLARKLRPRSNLKINVGYVMIPGNHEQIKDAVRDVKAAGADAIRFKYDISGRNDLKEAGLLRKTFAAIDEVKRNFEDAAFQVHLIHTEGDIEQKTHEAWQCSKGCDYQYFLGTIGSDGKMYLCDHNTMPAGVSLGVCIDEPIQEIWESPRKHYLSDGVQYTCQCTVCPPFGNRANFFLREIRELAGQYGVSCVTEAIHMLREEERMAA